MPTMLVAADSRLKGCDELPLATVALDSVFTGWHREATITWPERRMQLAIAADAPLDFLVVYSPVAQDYFCVEPVSHCTDAFNLAAAGRFDTGMVTLAPGAQLRATLRLRPAVLEPIRNA
jgi:aldose 1-epimerase